MINVTTILQSLCNKHIPKIYLPKLPVLIITMQFIKILANHYYACNFPAILRVIKTERVFC